VENVARIALHPRGARVDDVNEDAVRLTNGDELKGRVHALDDAALQLDTSYAGRVTVRRAMLASVVLRTYDRLVYAGPDDLRTWSIGASGADLPWRLNGAHLESTTPATIGRQVDIPDRSIIEFDLSSDSFPRFRFNFYTDTIQTYGGSCYMLIINPTIAHLGRMSAGQGQKTVGSAQTYRFKDAGRTRFRIYTDRNDASITLYVDGVRVHPWRDPDGFAGAGGGILFYPQSQGLNRLSNIRVREWTGKLPEPESEAPRPTVDRILLVNGDTAEGHVTAITNGATQIEASFRTIGIPLDRMQRIDFAFPEAQRARLYSEDARLFFRNDGYITLKIHAIDAQRVSGYSENYGDLSADLSAFQEVQFNLYRDMAAPELKAFTF
jgi:hypothetical protein